VLTLALPKGRLAEEAAELLKAKRLIEEKVDSNGKILTFISSNKKLKLLFVRSQDVCTYVEECVADLGIVGWDTILEGNYDLLCPIDLGIGACRLSVAAKPDFNWEKISGKLRVATKYPELSKNYFFRRGIACEVIKLYGSIELAPLVGLSDCIVDLVSTGTTLKANGLVEIDVVLESSARLVCHRSSYFSKWDEVSEFLQNLSPENSLFSSPFLKN